MGLVASTRRRQLGGVRSKSLIEIDRAKKRRRTKRLLRPRANAFRTSRSETKNLISENILRSLEKHDPIVALENFLAVIRYLMDERYDEDDVMTFLFILDPAIRDTVSEKEADLFVHFEEKEYKKLLDRPRMSYESIEAPVKFLRRFLRKAKKATKKRDVTEFKELSSAFLHSIYSTIRSQREITGKIGAMAKEDDELADLLEKLSF